MGGEVGSQHAAHSQRKLEQRATLKTISLTLIHGRGKQDVERGNILPKITPQVSGRPGATHCTQDALSSTLPRGYMDLIPLIEKGKKEPMLLNFHSTKIAEIYPSPWFQKSRLLFCKHAVFLSRGCLRAREAVGSLGHLREAEGRSG